MEVSEDLAKQLKTVPKSRWTLYVNKVLKEKLAKISRIERILAKSRLTEEKAYEISEKIDKALAERYEKLYNDRHGLEETIKNRDTNRRPPPHIYSRRD